MWQAARALCCFLHWSSGGQLLISRPQSSEKKKGRKKTGSVAAPAPLFVPSSSALLSCVFVRVCACDQHATPRATPKRGTGANSDKLATSALQMHFIFIPLQSGTEEQRFGWGNSLTVVRFRALGVGRRAGAEPLVLAFVSVFFFFFSIFGQGFYCENIL